MDKCQTCGKEVDGHLHACPFAQEINDNDDDNYCNCCEDCSEECALNV